jgi:hypothetical protein
MKQKRILNFILSCIAASPVFWIVPEISIGMALIAFMVLLGIYLCYFEVTNTCEMINQIKDLLQDKYEQKSKDSEEN